MALEENVRSRIAAIRFGILSPAEIQKLSVVEVTTSDTYDEDGMPIPSGLMDGRMGVLEPGQRCRTCFNLASRCPGHFGSIRLAVPVIHVAFAKHIQTLLSVTCRNCGRLLLSEEDRRKYRKLIDKHLAERGEVSEGLRKLILKKASRAYECPYCRSPQYKIELVKPVSFYEVSDEGRVNLDPTTIRSRLERIPDEDLKLIGYDPEAARPEWMVIQILPVPPLVVRPSITLESGIRSEDDLTHKLVDIVRINQRIKECIDSGAPTAIREELTDLLQYHVITYFDNETPGIPPARHRSGRPLRALSQRLKGKEGRFRLNLSGKRVDFSARTVISPDPNLKIEEVGVPLDIALKLTVPEKVTPWNLEEMKKLILRGPFEHPGAVYVIRPDGRRIRLEFTDRKRIAEELQPGYIVERHLRDGDIVLFNRQPSLHRMSVMAHRVKVLPYRTFRLHLAVCTPYNADFDGDEMNLHVPQSEEAQAEARLLMQVETQIISPRYGAPIIGATRDYLTAAYLLTRRSTLLTRDEVGKLLAAIDYKGELPPPAVEKPEPLWTGKQIFSLLLPSDFNYIGKASVCKHRHTSLLEEECPDDGIVHVKNGVLVRGVIDKGAIGVEKPDTLLHVYVKKYGSEAGRVFLNNLCRLLNTFISIKGFSYSLDELQLPEQSKRKIEEVLREAGGRVKQLIERFEKGALPKLPGKSLEESLEIKITDELARARERCDEIAEASLGMENRGVIMSRVGARGSALNIGHMSACLGQQSVRGRRIPRGFRGRSLPHFKPGDQSPEAGGFVSSSFLKGLSPTEFFFHAMGGREGLVDTAVRTQQSGYLQRRLIHALELLRVEYDGTVRDITGAIVQFKYGEDGIDPSKSDHGKAVNVERLLHDLRFKGVGRDEPPASRREVEDLLNRYGRLLPRSIIEEVKKASVEAKASRTLTARLLDEVLRAYEEAQVEPGEAIGVVAAQSIGEPGTQMTLRTFHWAGVRERDVTLGLPRLIEIMDARRTPSTPIMTVRLEEEYKHDRDKAVEVAKNLVYTALQDIVSRYTIDVEEGVVEFKLDPQEMASRGVSYEELAKLGMKDVKFELKPEENLLTAKPKTGKFLEEEGLRKLASKALSLHVKGVKGIVRAQVVEEEGEWVIQTEGSNLAEVIEVEGVDPARTETNNFFEIYEVLGVEAARNAIINETLNVFQGIGGGLDIDVRHIMLVADMMTRTGEIMQIGRHGVAGHKPSPLARAAFEITVPHIVESAVRGAVDELKGVTENIIVGQVMPVGTGFVDIFMEPPSLKPKS